MTRLSSARGPQANGGGVQDQTFLGLGVQEFVRERAEVHQLEAHQGVQHQDGDDHGEEVAQHKGTRRFADKGPQWPVPGAQGRDERHTQEKERERGEQGHGRFEVNLKELHAVNITEDEHQAEQPGGHAAEAGQEQTQRRLPE